MVTFNLLNGFVTYYKVDAIVLTSNYSISSFTL